MTVGVEVGVSLEAESKQIDLVSQRPTEFVWG